MTDVEFWTDTDPAAPVADFVTVCVVAGAFEGCVLVVGVGDADPDAVTLFSFAAADDTALLAFCAALDAAPLAAPDPQALTGSVAINRATAATISRSRLLMVFRPRDPARRRVLLFASVIARHHLRGRGRAQWGGHVRSAGAGTTDSARRAD